MRGHARTATVNRMKHRQMTGRSRYLLPPMRRSVLASIAAAVLLLLACSSSHQGPENERGPGPGPGNGDLPQVQEQQHEPPREPDVYEEVWSQTSSHS